MKQKISTQELYNIFQHPQHRILRFIDDISRPKILETNDNTIIRIFYPKKNIFSSDRLHPRAIRFYKNAAQLISRGYIAPNILSLKYCAEKNIYVMTYEKLRGTELRSCRELMTDAAVFQQMVAFIAKLHQHGIFFRSIHLGNLLWEKNQPIKLLDITDVRFKKFKINFHMCYRNLKHLFYCRDDAAFWNQERIQAFLKYYYTATKASPLTRKYLNWRFIAS